MSSRSGLFCVILAYTIWGLFPIYWRQIHGVNDLEIVAHRMIWSCVFVLLMVLLMRQWRDFLSLLKQPTLIFRLAVGAFLVSLNWGIFIIAVNSGHIVEAAMGYFINPLITIVFGVIFFAERLRITQWIAVFIMLLGIAYQIFMHGHVPYIALSLAATFSCYSVIKKSVKVPATFGLAVESSLMLIPAALCLLYVQQSSDAELAFGNHSPTDMLLVLAGLASLTPLLLFAASAKVLSMTAIGMTQYIGPTLQLLIGVYLYNEPFDQVRLISFGLIWFALLVYTVDQIQHQARQTRVSLV